MEGFAPASRAVVPATRGGRPACSADSETRASAASSAIARPRTSTQTRAAARACSLSPPAAAAAVRSHGRTSGLLLTPRPAGTAPGAKLRRSGLPSFSDWRRQLRLPARNRSESAAALQRPRTFGRRSGSGQDHRSLPGVEGVLGARHGAQGPGAGPAFAGHPMERRVDREVRLCARLAGWRGIPARSGTLLEPHVSVLAGTPWDMVVVDEAHCLKNRASANWKLVDSLEKRFILMLTATPVENNLIELYNLITLLKPGLLATESEFRKLYVNAAKPKSPKNPDQLRALLAEVMIRNTRSAADVRLPHRVAASVVVAPSDTEAELYERVSAFVAARYKTGKQSGVMALDWMQRQAGSSPQALHRSIVRRLSDRDRPERRDVSELESILDLASRIGDGSKGFQLGEMLAGRKAKTVVFTEFVPTLEHLAEICRRRGIRYALFSGDLSRGDKDAAIARFRDEADVLLSTGAGGEGRNLQFADTVINFDLPWNPMRLEQRVGRVHRIGQQHDVFIFNFCQAGTVEEHLLRVLHDKVNMFELVVGEMDAILGSLDDARDFAELVMDLWLSAREAGQASPPDAVGQASRPVTVEQAFDDLAQRLLAAKAEHAKVKEFDEALFHRDFEV